MSRFPPMYLNNDENNIVSSIIEEEASELKDATFSTQSNISMQEDFNSKSFQNREYKSPHSLPQSKTPHQISPPNFKDTNYQSEYNSNFNIENISDIGSKDFIEKSHNDDNYKKYDINAIKNEVDNLMSHVRETSKIIRSSPRNDLRFADSLNGSNKNQNYHPMNSPMNKKSPSLNQSENNFTHNNSSTQSPFVFQAASDIQSPNLSSNHKIQNQYENYDMNSSVTSIFSNKWQNYDNNNSNSFSKNTKSSPYSMPHVEFPDFQNKYSQSKSPFAKYSRKSQNDDFGENEAAQFVMPQAEFPDAPKVLQYRFSRKPDSSKQDLADLDHLRKENFKLKAEMLKLEKRLQLEEEEHKKLVNSLEKSERIRAEYRARIEQQNK